MHSTAPDKPRLKPPTTQRRHCDGSQRKDRAAAASALTRDTGLHQRSSTTITVYRKPLPQRALSADAPATALGACLQEESVYELTRPQLHGVEDFATPSMDDDGRQVDVSPAFEEEQTRYDKATELNAEPRSFSPPPKRQPTTTPEKEGCEIIPFSEVSDEKLRLLKKLVASGHLPLSGAKVEIEVREKRIRVSGTTDQIEAVRTKVLEVLSRVCCDAVGVSQSQLPLVMSERGRRWFRDILAQSGRELVVVLYTKDAEGYVAGQDDDAVSHAKSVLRKSLATETIPFGVEVSSEFMQSRQWTDAVEKYESKWFVRVTCDHGAGTVLVDGCVRAVKQVGAKIRQLLGQNYRASHTIQLKPGEYRLVEQHLKAEISQCLKNQRG